MPQPPAEAEPTTSPGHQVNSPRRSRPLPSHFLDPPLSPPPTSPLPLPPSIPPSPVTSLKSSTPPPRPPRPQTSLPDLRFSRRASLDHSHRTCRFVINTPGQISSSYSPLPVPAKAHLPTVTYARLPAESSSTRTNAESTSHRASPSPRNGRIWWSYMGSGRPSATDALSGCDAIQDSTTYPAIRAPNCRSKDSPKKAVARSPLHIPPGTARMEEEIRNSTTSYASSDNHAPLLHTELISSLPLWPEVSATEYTYRRAESHPSPRENSGAEETLHKSCTIIEKDDVEDGSVVAERPISFRAVTNLEQDFTMEQSRGTVSIDSVSPTPPKPWHQQHRRQLWGLATLIAILIATGGMLAGVIWKLRQSK